MKNVVEVARTYSTMGSESFWSHNYITFWKSYKSFKISRKLIPPSASKNRANSTSKILRLHFVVRTRATLASVCQTGRKWLSSICVPDFGVPWVFEFWPNDFCILNKLSQRTVGQMLSVHTLKFETTSKNKIVLFYLLERMQTKTLMFFVSFFQVVCKISIDGVLMPIYVVGPSDMSMLYTASDKIFCYL